MNQFPILNLLPPVEDGDGVNKTYCVTQLSVFGGTMDGEIDMQNNRIKNVNINPNFPDEVVQKQWIEEHFSNKYGPPTMTRNLNMDGNSILHLKQSKNKNSASKFSEDLAATTKSESKAEVKQEIMDDVNTAVGNANSEAGEQVENTVSREIRTRTINMGPDGAQRGINLGGHRVISVSDPEYGGYVVNLHIMIEKIPSELERNILLENRLFFDLMGKIKWFVIFNSTTTKQLKCLTLRNVLTE